MPKISILIITTNRKYSFIDIRKDNHFLILSLYIIYYSIKIKLYNTAPNTGYGTIMVYSDVITLSLL